MKILQKHGTEVAMVPNPGNTVTPCLQANSRREDGGGGGWDPKVCIPRMARSDLCYCKIRFSFTTMVTLVGGGWVGLGWVKASPGRQPTVRTAFPAGPDWAAIPGCPVTRPTGLLTAPRPRSGARGREMPPSLCVCALVCLRAGGGGGAVAHLPAPLLFGVGTHGAGKCAPGASGPGREAGEPDAEPARGDVGLGSQPPRHKDKLPNRSTTTCWHGKAVVRGTTGVRPTLLDCPWHRWCCHVDWVWLPTAEAYPGQVEGPQGAESASLPWVPPVLAAQAAALQPA